MGKMLHYTKPEEQYWKYDMSNALTSSFCVCGVKNDAMDFILFSFKLTFCVMFLIWYSIAFSYQKVLQDI